MAVPASTAAASMTAATATSASSAAHASSTSSGAAAQPSTDPSTTSTTASTTTSATQPQPHHGPRVPAQEPLDASTLQDTQSRDGDAMRDAQGPDLGSRPLGKMEPRPVMGRGIQPKGAGYMQP